MTRNEVVQKIIDFFDDNEDALIECIEDLDSWNGYLGDNKYYSMDELSELFSGCDIIDVLNRAYFGYDSETWHTDSHGEKEYGAFNPNRDFFTFNGYGNFVSSDSKDYSAFNDEYFVDALIENKNHLYCIDEYQELNELLAVLDDIERGA